MSHVDALTQASVALVDFPAGWIRPRPGRYSVGEEFVVLSGELAMDGVRYGPGAWAWAPPGAERRHTASSRGARALAWFSGLPTWHGADSPRDRAVTNAEDVVVVRTAPLVAGTMRAREPTVPGCSGIQPTAPQSAANVDRDLLAIASWRWAFVPAGDVPPPLPGPVLVRHWR